MEPWGIIPSWERKNEFQSLWPSDATCHDSNWSLLVQVNDLLSDDTKSVLEQVLTNHVRSCGVRLRASLNEMLKLSIIDISLKIFKIKVASPRAHGFTNPPDQDGDSISQVQIAKFGEKFIYIYIHISYCVILETNSELYNKIIDNAE